MSVSRGPAWVSGYLHRVVAFFFCVLFVVLVPVRAFPQACSTLYLVDDVSSVANAEFNSRLRRMIGGITGFAYQDPIPRTLVSPAQDARGEATGGLFERVLAWTEEARLPTRRHWSAPARVVMERLLLTEFDVEFISAQMNSRDSFPGGWRPPVWQNFEGRPEQLKKTVLPWINNPSIVQQRLEDLALALQQIHLVGYEGAQGILDSPSFQRNLEAAIRLKRIDPETSSLSREVYVVRAGIAKSLSFLFTETGCKIPDSLILAFKDLHRAGNLEWGRLPSDAGPTLFEGLSIALQLELE